MVKDYKSCTSLRSLVDCFVIDLTEMGRIERETVADVIWEIVLEGNKLCELMCTYHYC